MASFKSPEKIQNMFNQIADRYDFINNVMSIGLHRYVKFLSVKNLEIPTNAVVLDLCTGTGDLADFIKKSHPSATIVGVDFSEKMLEIAKNRVKNVEFIKEDATQLSFADNSFDIVTMGFGLRNIEDSHQAVAEVFRVLKSGGKFMHLDFGKKNNFANAVFDFIIPKLVKIFYKNAVAYEYLIQSKQEFSSPDELIKNFESAGFKFLKRRDYLFGIISCQILIA